MTTYQWRRDDVDLPGVTASAYTLAAGDVGHLISCYAADGTFSGVSREVGPIVAAGGGGGALLVAWVADPVASNFGSPWVGEGHLPASVGRVIHVTDSASLINALNTALDGDTILLASGVYSNINIQDKIHSPSNPVTVMPEIGATVFIRTTGSTSSVHHAWYMFNCQGFKFVGLTFDLAYQNCFEFDHFCKDIEIFGCSLTNFASVNTGHGVLVTWECERIAIWNTAFFNGGDHGVYLGSQGQPSGTARWGVKGLIVGNCKAYDNHKGVGAASGESAGFGIQLGDSVAHARVINCTVDGNGQGALYSGGMNLYTQGSVLPSGEHGTDVDFINCLDTNNHGWGITCPGSAPNRASNLITYNLVSGNSAGQINGASMMTQVAPNWVVGNPLYANRSAKDFHISAAGAAFNIANPGWMPSTDFDGTPRTSADLGCYQSS